MAIRQKNFNICIFCCAVLAYFFNELFLKKYTSGAVLYFFVCYFNDILAGVLMLSFTNYLLVCSKHSLISSFLHIIIFILICSVFWEFAHTFLPTGGIFDPYDFVAYSFGGIFYFILLKLHNNL